MLRTFLGLCPVMTAICASLAPIGAARVRNVPLKDDGTTEPVSLAAAALHDTIEATETGEQEVGTLFGDAIASLVLAMSDATSPPKAARKRQQIEACPAYEPRGRTREARG
jgi:(p)ppGpp synthase/HD superfamily hydrolase